MSNETVVFSILIFVMFVYAMLIGIEINMLLKRIERIEQILTFWKRSIGKGAKHD